MIKNKQLAIIYTAIGTFLVLIAVTIALNFNFLKDFFTAVFYQPSDEMSEIRDDLKLTGKGWVIFGASEPELLEKTEFNQYCRDKENTSAILGCYRSDKIYVYNIIDDELEGIRELTAAHELLHAVYDRMSEVERKKWGEILAEVYENEKAALGEEIEAYEEEQRAEELYVRAGTEIKELPEELERHFAEIFEDQDLIVACYESYIQVFKEIEAKMNEISAKIEDLKAGIDAKINEYEAAMNELNSDISEFNSCAETANCFSSTAVFNRQRNALIARRDTLSALYEEINTLISEHNNLVAQYNENVLHGQTLSRAINSSVETEGL